MTIKVLATPAPSAPLATGVLVGHTHAKSSDKLAVVLWVGDPDVPRNCTTLGHTMRNPAVSAHG